MIDVHPSIHLMNLAFHADLPRIVPWVITAVFASKQKQACAFCLFFSPGKHACHEHEGRLLPADSQGSS
jgi:hypothetical protein